jgi:tetratricopeptide (TPR) repeat protein
MVMALVGVSTLLWGRSRLSSDVGAQLDTASFRGDWGRIAVLARQRLKEAPDDPQALRLSARGAANQDRDRTAIAIYSRLTVGDMDAEDFYLLGRALSRTGQNDRALKAFEAVHSVNPDHPETLDALGRLYLKNDRYAAVEQMAGRLARQPGWEPRGQLMLGIARAELNDPAGAAQALARFFQLDPEGRAAAPDPVGPYQKLLVRSLLKSRQPEEARQSLERVLTAGPDREASWLLSRCFLQAGDWGRAGGMLEPGPPFRAGRPFEAEPAPYVGSARCAECHRSIYQAVLASRHATTFARSEELRDLPLPEGPLPDPGNPKVTHAFERAGDSILIETHTGDKVLRAVVDYAFGSRDHFMSFVGRDDQGQGRTIRLSHYTSPKGSGWDLTTGHPTHPEDEGEYVGKALIDGDGVRRCLYCHTTNFRAILDQVGPEAADHSIGCETCHGPGAHHVAAVNAGFSDIAIANPGKAPEPRIDEVCGQCHTLGDTSIISAPRTDPVWFRFQSLALTWSRCYSESGGKLNCVTCHDPHRNAETSAERNEAKCLSCHAADPKTSTSTTSSPTPPLASGRTEPSQAKQNSRAARTTCPVNPAKGCIACHMPRAWVQSTHSFKTDHYIRVHDRRSTEN